MPLHLELVDLWPGAIDVELGDYFKDLARLGGAGAHILNLDRLERVGSVVHTLRVGYPGESQCEV